MKEEVDGEGAVGYVDGVGFGGCGVKAFDGAAGGWGVGGGKVEGEIKGGGQG